MHGALGYAPAPVLVLVPLEVPFGYELYHAALRQAQDLRGLGGRVGVLLRRRYAVARLVVARPAVPG